MEAACTENRKKGISGSTLKWIALATMFLDHIGAVIIYQGFFQPGLFHTAPAALLDPNTANMLVDVYHILRKIGRLSFPFFCFLLVEGFIHTKNVKKYALRLLVFACVSEIPFNLAIGGSLWTFDHQNVLFTMFTGLAVMYAIRRYTNELTTVRSFIITVLIAGAGACLAEFLNMDYHAWGVLSITVIYLFRQNKILQNLMGAASFLWELPAPLSFVITYFYNGERGRQSRYFFYIFYPTHLIFLWLIARYGIYFLLS